MSLPGPRRSVVGKYGNLFCFMQAPTRYMSRLYEAYGDIVTLARGKLDYVFVFGPELNRAVLRDVEHFHNLEVGSSPLRMKKDSPLLRLFSGLTHCNGAQHARQRRLMTPAFHKERLEVYGDAMMGIIDAKLSQWRAGERRDLYREMRELTLSIAVRTLLGIDSYEGGQRLCGLMDRWMRMVFSVWVMLFPFPLPGTPYRQLIELSHRLESEITTLIQHKRSACSDAGDALSLLLQLHDASREGLADEELVGQANFLVVAGYLTTATALTWTILLLTQHPHVMRNVLDELQRECAGDTVTISQLERLPLLDSVIKETLRLLPPVTWWSRVTSAQATLAAHHLPVGAHVVFSPYVTHRIPSIYPMPERFLPERWQHFNPGPYEYLPFSGGPRMCLGSGLEMKEMRLILAMLLQRYALTVPPHTRVDAGGIVFLEPRGGLPVVVRPRNHQGEQAPIGGTIRTLVCLD